MPGAFPSRSLLPRVSSGAFLRSDCVLSRILPPRARPPFWSLRGFSFGYRPHLVHRTLAFLVALGQALARSALSVVEAEATRPGLRPTATHRNHWRSSLCSVKRLPVRRCLWNWRYSLRSHWHRNHCGFVHWRSSLRSHCGLARLRRGYMARPLACALLPPLALRLARRVLWIPVRVPIGFNTDSPRIVL